MNQGEEKGREMIGRAGLVFSILLTVVILAYCTGGSRRSPGPATPVPGPARDVDEPDRAEPESRVRETGSEIVTPASDVRVIDDWTGEDLKRLPYPVECTESPGFEKLVCETPCGKVRAKAGSLIICPDGSTWIADP